MRYLCIVLLLASIVSLAGPAVSHEPSYAVFAEMGRANKSMAGGVNRRVFNKVVASRGSDVALQADGAIRVQPGTYHISGYSLVTIQDSLNVKASPLLYPGYCLLYESRYERDRAGLLKNVLALGCPSTACYASPSIFDTVVTFSKPIEICLGHQAGNDVSSVFLTFVDGDPAGASATRVFAQVSIFRVGE